MSLQYLYIGIFRDGMWLSPSHSPRIDEQAFQVRIIIWVQSKTYRITFLSLHHASIFGQRRNNFH